MTRVIYACIAFILFAFNATGQTTYTSAGQYWFRYFNQLQFNERLSLHSELDERGNFEAPHHSQFFVHIHLHYKPRPWLDMAAGQNFNLTSLPLNPSVEVPEWRPWQEINILSAGDRKWVFQFRYRLDERFVHNNNGTELEDGYHFNLRHRFRIQAGTTLIEKGEDWKLSLRFSEEVMLNSGDVPHTLDQNRIFCALEYRINKNWSVESGYLNIIQPRTDTEYLVRNVVRTTLFHRIRL